MSRVVVAGDVHLGAHNSDAEAFAEFLDELHRRQEEVDEVVLLGDLWDMVRRDPFGVAWETSGILDGLKRLADVVPVRYVLGNHDVYLRDLDGGRYELDFRESYTLEQDGVSVHFRHGHEFDGLHSNRVSSFLSGPGDRGDIDPTRGLKDPVVAGAREVICRTRGWLRADGGEEVYPRRERRAHDFAEGMSADKLVYGHTHSPYVNHDGVVANAGSWKSTAPVHNTYVEVSGGNLRLYEYRRGGEDRRLD